MKYNEVSIEINSGRNASLLSNNSFFNLVRKNEEIYLVHVTKNKELIEKTGFLYPSGGCLLGSVYFTPGTKCDDGSIRLHNLGRYYYERECPNVIKNRKLKGQPSIYVFRLKCKNRRNRIQPINYLKFGKMHYDIYNRLCYLLTNEEQKKLENIIYKKLTASLPFLQKIKTLKNSSNIKEKYNLLNLLIENVKNLPILGYVYFETLNKTLMLHQSDKISQKYYKKGEFYNWIYKDMMLYFYPDFFSKFNLGTFNVDFEEVKKYIIKNKLVDSINDFELDFFDQLFIFLSDILDINNSENIQFLKKDLTKKIDQYPNHYHSLIGHMIHRELRDFKRYPDFYFYFDQIKALDMWNYWNKNDILIPYNGIIPKGEIGLNPAYLENLEYEVYEGIDYKVIDDFAYVKLGKKKNIKIAKKLVENKYTMMRNYMSMK